MITSFTEALKELLVLEGGYSNNSKDHGGETYKGISRVYFPKWEGWSIVDSYSVKKGLYKDKELANQVAEFYKKFFWDKLSCGDLNNKHVASLLFTFAVNAGKKKAAKKLQRLLQCAEDGYIGPITIGKANNYINHNGSELFFMYLLETIEFYTKLGKTQPAFLRGWINRSLKHYYNWDRERINYSSN